MSATGEPITILSSSSSTTCAHPHRRGHQVAPPSNRVLFEADDHNVAEKISGWPSTLALVCHAFDATLNDVALAAITHAFRAMLIRRGEKPQRNSLRTLVPVSVRSNDATEKVDNRVSLIIPYLPVGKSDPEDQLQTVHRRLTGAKHSGQRQAGHVIISAANIIPFPLTAWVVGAVTRLPQRSIVSVATNVPGRHRLTRSVVVVDGFTGERRFIENRPVRSDHRIDRKDFGGAQHEHIADGDLVDGHRSMTCSPAGEGSDDLRRRAQRRDSGDQRPWYAPWQSLGSN